MKNEKNVAGIFLGRAGLNWGLGFPLSFVICHAPFRRRSSDRTITHVRTLLVKAIGLWMMVMIFNACSRQPKVPSRSPLDGLALVLTNQMTHGEVLAKFRERASPAEIQNFERLSMATNADSQIQAKEIVLYKLTSDELSRIGITQSEYDGRFFWTLATSIAFADGGKAFEKALDQVGVKPNGVMDLGIVWWSVPREQFFVAQRALLNANLRTNEVRIVEVDF